ncbi:cobalamin biosynthesis protein [Actinomycetospora sp. TBRC 11914]|uniref:cobalamin biosynthesis protein n=1 Tax=Actinomycetospora sp. TBRC 11914 TaxID=2729387 RepID=UPI00145CAF67|nr:cobalamin biosynthesis protein [Actinomycetospora sp. TBRC 11914]NMO90527.1 cobalamin biosynthesis protein [Actinomycetospora sp. TBRC 11914]
MIGRVRGRATGLLAGVVADALLGDPRRGHPVAVFGTGAARLERAWWADSRSRGALYAGVLVGGAVLGGAAAERVAARSPVATAAVTALATWAVLGGRSLAGEGAALAGELAADDLGAARRRLPSLCGRDPSALDADGLARAALESVAENTSDAVVAPLVWGAVAGVPGLLGYRAVNTLDAMVGHLSARHARFGWASARADDVANAVPARLAALLTATTAPVVGGRPGAALTAWRRDARRHPSPNAGPVEAAFAGALGRRLGGRTVYPYGVQERPLLGSGPAPRVPDLHRAVRLSRVVTAGAALAAAGLAAAIDRAVPEGFPRRRP